ncbi:unnamed protein product [Malassezia sympodialis ATCC 42132]|uniref:26S proteasome regulatory subunit RPN2 n=1 Tax=Malassezia sympodialis (strain ATCC 42132) TaxID=1230383 RepID=M5EL32_MALS4|nr:uncharacterized protein MSY001_1045 [Malassezia sympodialis ATCC 42132]CCU98339.1 unnamed protein product [Malassezia sympodialis ATCC 42132]SHO75850.1 Similar to S.cerevisiae protein RPN2 (Subunit of the 26S proteasome) [Malassezia sympodialis ATCC 42132]|eukprot:XP_018739652.1 uncharacterized protein MSY001_1045 [Malassezia sympodialis ATCC 42132]
MVVPSLTSVAGVTALLDEQDPKLQSYALQKLNTLVDRFWTELADAVARIEELYEDESFTDRRLAALVASKVYFYLGEFEDALNFALGAEALFDVDQRNEYIETVVSKAIDQYVAQRSDPQAGAVDERLTNIVDKMMSHCIQNREYRQALGIALETRRLDVIEHVFELTHDKALLTYVLEMVMSVIADPEARRDVLNLLVRLFQSLDEPDYFSTAQCYVYLNEPQLTADLLRSLLQRADKEERTRLIAYQVAFDLVDGATQEFLRYVQADLSKGEQLDSAFETTARILSGKETIRLYREFLHSANHADLMILKGTKDALDAHYSAYHSAVSLSNAFMHAGTGSDQFLRENLDWLAKASNWSKFTATAALGVLHRGSLEEGLTILRPYLPPENGAPSSSVYSEGGSLFALGLIHANHGASVLDLLTQTLRTNTAEVVQHGAALGLGAAGMATENEEVYEELRTLLFSDSAVSGEAAGYAMGLVYLGTGSEQATEEMLQYAQETQHEKIIRGLAIGIALLHYGRESAADTVIEQLLVHKDATLRYGGIYTMALAYAGTGHNRAVSRLLHMAVSDGSDDVRRASVIALGFLLFRTPDNIPEMVQLLSESYNPHLRYGAAIALGIACAGTGLDAALELLEPLTKDTVDFVRQGACMALAMVLVQLNDTLHPRAQSVRKTFDRIITEKHEEAMAKFGAALAQGLIDAGGRNVTISLQGRGGSTNTAAVVGMALFTQYWYWFPMAHFASLAFTPTSIVGVTSTLEMPALELVSHARPSLFAYPPALQGPSEKKLEKVETAVLSTTAKSQARQRTKEKKKAQETMDMDAEPEAETGAPADAKTTEGTKSSDAPGPDTVEPKEERLPNGSRVTPFQLRYVTFPPDSRYAPVRPIAGQAVRPVQADAVSARQLDLSVTGGRGGILLLEDREPNAPFVPAKASADDGASAKSMDHEAAAKALAESEDAEADKGPTGVDDAAPAPAAAGPSEDVNMDEQAR